MPKIIVILECIKGVSAKFFAKIFLPRSPNMLYESRRILLGFRIKLNFDASLNRENSYIFVNLSKTPTIRDLLGTIKDRFEISQNVYITLNDCRLLNSEDNAVLVDVSEIRIVPCKSERNVVPGKTQEFVPLIQDRLSVYNSPVQTNTKSECRDEISGKRKVFQPCSNEAASISQNNGVSRASEIPDRKCRRFYGSVAETIRYLNEIHKPVSEGVSVLPNNVTSSECEDRNENNSNGVKEQEKVSNGEESCSENKASFEDASDELVDKRKRKRKRKHSKKPKLECDQEEKFQFRQNGYSGVETNSVGSLSNKSARQHIFFDGKDDESFEFEEHPKEQDLSSNASGSPPLINGKVQKFANGDERAEINVIDKKVAVDVTDGYCFKMAKCNKFEEKPTVPDVVSEPSAISFKKIPKLECDTMDIESTNVKYPATCGRSTQWQLTSMSTSNEGFFSKFNSTTNGCSNIRAKEIVSESRNPLATLLMCKQLQTPVEYNVQFTRVNGIIRTSSNSLRIPRESNQINASVSITNQKSTTGVNNDASAIAAHEKDNECEVLCQYKIVGAKVLLRDSNGIWNTLSVEDTSSKLQPIDEPRENQSITFQILYLGANMCPSMSDLICGKVISFQKDDGRLTLTILPAFLDNLAKCGEEGTSLPDELVHVTENVYQILWLAVKNPRLLM